MDTRLKEQDNPSPANDSGIKEAIVTWDDAMQRAFKGIRTRGERHRNLRRSALRSQE